MTKKYKVLCGGGIDFGGRNIEQGKTFEAKDAYLPWCEAMVRRGHLARGDAPPAKRAKV